MMVAFEAVQIGSLVLLSILLILLLRGHVWKHPILFAYNLSLFTLSLLDMILFHGTQRQTHSYFKLFWTSELVWDVLLFALAAVLILRVLADRPEREFARKILWVIVAAMIVLPFVIFPGRKLFETPWFSGTSQLLNFGAAILSLVLWGALIISRHRDPQLMLVCVGLGVNVAGGSLAWGVHLLARGPGLISNAAYLFAGITYLLGLAIWCYAFWPATKPSTERPQ